jgi:hypothetical protein
VEFVIPVLLIIAVAAWLLRLVRNRRQVVHADTWWGPLFNERGWEDFCGAVRDYYQAHDLAINLDAEAGVIHEGTHRLGLQNIAQACAHSAREDWPRLIAAHFDDVRQAFAQQASIAEEIVDYAGARDLLAVRLWPESMLATLDSGQIVYTRDLDGVLSTLVFDFPKWTRQVMPREARQWGHTHEELVEQALGNVHARYPVEVNPQILSNGVHAWLFSGEHFYVASHALLLARYPQCVGPHGALVGVPARQVMPCYPIAGREVGKAVQAMIPIISSLEARGPGSISPHLYWYHAERFTRLPYEADARGLKFLPPASFVRLLKELAEESG